MAETPPSREELDLRRRARRRLVGAVALALMAVVVLPMVFDPEPRPLGDKVDIRIPGQETPFEAAPTPSAPASPSPEPAAAKVAAPVVPAQPAPAKEPAAAQVPAAKPVAAKAEVAAKPNTPAKPDAPAKKPEAPLKQAEAAKKAEPTKPEAVAKPETAAAAYYLQLGVFSSAANAAQMVAKAKVAGFKASSTAVGSQFKVRIGPVAERGTALDYQGKLKARGLAAVLVEP